MAGYIARLVNSDNGDEVDSYEFTAENDDDARDKALYAWRHLHVQIERKDEETGKYDELPGPYITVC